MVVFKDGGAVLRLGGGGLHSTVSVEIRRMVIVLPLADGAFLLVLLGHFLFVDSGCHAHLEVRDDNVR